MRASFSRVVSSFLVSLCLSIVSFKLVSRWEFWFLVSLYSVSKLVVFFWSLQVLLSIFWIFVRSYSTFFLVSSTFLRESSSFSSEICSFLSISDSSFSKQPTSPLIFLNWVDAEVYFAWNASLISWKRCPLLCLSSLTLFNLSSKI